MTASPSERGQGTRAALPETPMQRERATTIYEKSKPGRRAAALPEPEVPEKPLAELIPEHLLRTEPPNLPEIAEPEIVRHYNRLSRRNFDLDSGFYPLGSCTMKHNPRLNERVAALPGHARLHPAQDPRRAQGALELMWLLQESLAEICGLPHVSLQPSAGSHGELAGLLLTRAFHADRGEQRTKVLAPDTSHGTNPASVTMAGYEAVKVATNERGGVDIEDLKAKIDADPDQVACLMLTNPNTLGLFDENIEQIAALIHAAGGTLYYDGANLNAVMGHSRPGDMGFDIVHVNLHKSFSQPHGGGGPGAGPIAVSERIEPFLPRPQVVRRARREGEAPWRERRGAMDSRPSQDEAGYAFDLDLERPKSIGRLRGFQGNFGVFVRSYAYILSLGADGLAEASETAVLNANYLKARLATGRAGERLPVAFDRHCMHEFVLSGKPMKKELGVATLDLAKRLLDFGFHPPTVYFPLLVDEALMIEPTETETKESLDAFAAAIDQILAEAEADSEVAKQAPYTTPVRRLDEVKATRKPVVRQPLGGQSR
ncbi:MAG: aminomethyl-transferring glycine dehydrogenase subunit GcvPB [Solirubrobacterales bacterium]